jgi:molybdopterin converting factor small subunit
MTPRISHIDVHVPSPLRSYTSGQSRVAATGDTVDEVLKDIDHAHPGMRFRMIDEHDRIRAHMRVFVNSVEVADLRHALRDRDVVHLVCALSGG